MTTVLLLAVLCVGLYAVYLLHRAQRPGESDTDRFTRELLENLRRDLSDTKDKLHDGVLKGSKGVQERLEKTLEIVNQQLAAVQQRMDHRLDKSLEQIHQRLDKAADFFGKIQEQYGAVEAVSKGIRQLQEVFAAPKFRGGFGEKLLTDLVAQALPSSLFRTQVEFKGGDTVDLLIQTASGSIPVDAKFPKDNFERLMGNPEDEAAAKAFGKDVRDHIRAVAKYIRPEEGTVDFAIMYVPSDAVMYEILADRELASFAQKSNVLISSPHVFHYVIGILYRGYQTQRFAEHARQALDLIRGMKQQSLKLGDQLRTLGSHLVNAQSKMGEVGTSHQRLDQQIDEASSMNVEEGGRQQRLPTVEVGERKLVAKGDKL